MEKNNRDDELFGLDDLDKYRHYVDESYDFESENKNTSVNNNTDKSEKANFEDVSSFSNQDEAFFMKDVIEETTEDSADAEEKNMKENFFTKNKHRNLKIIILAVAIAVLITAGCLLFYAYYTTRNAEWEDSGIDHNTVDEEIIENDDHSFKPMGDVDANSLNEFLYAWANNGGEKMYSKNVINVLLCGVDSQTGKADSGRSDTMMLISLNKKTKKITMVSLLRDCWTYMRLPKRDGSTYDHYFKLNSAYRYGGPATLLETLENNFKIEIDEFIAVDFKSFPKLIDAVGGVTVDVLPYESNYIRRTSSQKNFPSGKSTLNGKQALIYSRIRHSDADADVSRTRRQRSVIKGLINSAKKASKGQLLNAFKQVSPYMRTGFSQTEVFGLIAQAYTYGWMDYEMVELIIPSKDYVDRISTYVNGQSTWVVDYALCAQNIQKALYGETNIVLAADRKSALDLVTNREEYAGSSSGGSESSGTEDASGPTENEEENSSGYEEVTTAEEGGSSTEPEESTKKPWFPDLTLPSITRPSETDPSETMPPTEPEPEKTDPLSEDA